MALIQVNYVSKSLFRTVTLNVILPVDKLDAETMNYMSTGKKIKTLYLLHGLIGNYTDWVSGTRIQRWAEEKDLAVVMPSGDNAFYVNSMAPNNDYGKFIGEELVEVTRMMFPLSDKREDTFIGGLSVGGFGAMRNGLKYAETFGRIVCLSGALHILDPDCDNLANEQLVFGDVDAARQTDANPEVCLKQLQDRIAAGEKLSIPTTYIACGMDDGLLGVNRKYRDLLTAAGADVTYEEEPGFAHEWDFWDRQIGKVVNGWLPLEDAQGGVNSGNVRGEN